MPRFQTQDMILIYLEGFDEFVKDEEVPYSLTPPAIAGVLGVDESELFSTLNAMEADGLIKEDIRPVADIDRERNVYFLTEKGKRYEEEFWSGIRDKRIILRDNGFEKKLDIKDLEHHISGRNPVVRGLQALDQDYVIDKDKLREPFEVFVGRRNELNRLKEHLKQVKRSGAMTMFIEGNAGIGKTSLVYKLKPFAEEMGFQFLSGTCLNDASEPYLPFKEAFSGSTDDEPGDYAGMAFIGSHLGKQIDDKRLFDAMRKETFFETTAYVKDMAQEQPLLVFLDDLQWVDKATLNLLAFMEEQLEDSPVLFIGTYRPEDLSEDHHLIDMMHRFVRMDRLNKMELKPLSYNNTKDMIKGELGVQDVPEHFVDSIHRKTEGNPFFIKETIRHMWEEGFIDPTDGRYPKKDEDISISRSVQYVMERRIGRLDPDTRRVVEYGGVIGGTIPFDLLLKVADMDEIDMLDHLDILTSAELWEEGEHDEAFSFSHRMLEEIVYSKIRRLKKKMLHRNVAESIEEIYEGRLGEWYSDLARHYEASGEKDKALSYYKMAGERAEKMFASEDAVDMYEKALALAESDEDKIDMIDKLAKTSSILGRFETAREHLYDALDIKEEQSIYRKIAITYNEQGEWDKTLEVVEKALPLEGSEPEETFKLLGLKGWALMKQGDYDRALKIFEEEKKTAEKLDIESGQVYHDLGTIYIRIGRLDEAIELLEKAIEIREKKGDLKNIHKSLNNLGIAYKDRGNREKCKECFEKTLRVLEENNLVSEIPAALNNVGFINAIMGKLDKAIGFYKRSLDLSHKIGSKENQALSLGNLGDAYSKKGELEKARENILKAIDLMEEMGYSYGLIVDLQYLGSLDIKEGKMEDAEAVFQRALDISRECGNRMREAVSLNKLGDLYALRGDLEKSEEYHMESKDISMEIGAKDIEALTCDRLGLISRWKGDVDEAERLHRKGLDIGKKINDDENTVLNLIGLGEDLVEKGGIKNWETHSYKVIKVIDEWEYLETFIRNHLLIARCRREQEDYAGAKEHIDLALARCRKVKDLTWEARVLFEYGILDKMRGYDGSDHLQSAVELFQRCRMEWWEERAKEML